MSMAYYKEQIQDKEVRKNQIIAIITVIIVYIIMVFCFIFLGLTYQVPPPPEYGIEVDMSGGGGGGSSGSNSATPTTATTTASKPSQKIYTQHTDPTTAITSGNENNTQTEPAPTINENAMFKPRAKQGGDGEGTGIGPGKGSGIGPGTGGGTGGGDGDGHGPGDGDFWLDGRPVIKKAFPRSKNNLEGVVVVEFRADKTGTVIYAKAGVKGTTIADADVWRECEKAAKESKFKSKADASAEEKGVIRYRFIIQ